MRKITLLLAATLISASGYAHDTERGKKNQYRNHKEAISHHHHEVRNRYGRTGYERSEHNRRSDKDARNTHRKWQTVSSFRGRSGIEVTRSIPVHEKVKALSIQGTKRGMIVRRAYAVMGNGRWVRLHGLEGRILRGDQVRQRLNHPRHVRRVVLDIAPSRFKRGSGELKVRTAR
jgi:hypothetical protein